MKMTVKIRLECFLQFIAFISGVLAPGSGVYPAFNWEVCTNLDSSLCSPLKWRLHQFPWFYSELLSTHLAASEELVQVNCAFPINS